MRQDKAGWLYHPVMTVPAGLFANNCRVAVFVFIVGR